MIDIKKIMTISGRILLHTCCAPCATTCIERLIPSCTEVLLFFSNSNIFPADEYLERLENARKLADLMKLSLEEGFYDHDAWLSYIHGFEDEPEHGLRCRKCFEFNFIHASRKADLLNFPAFTTSLTVSRYKSSRTIFEVGKAFPNFEPIDFKKDNGYARSIELSKVYDLYRQNYCGCEFSKCSKIKLPG